MVPRTIWQHRRVNRTPHSRRLCGAGAPARGATYGLTELDGVRGRGRDARWDEPKAQLSINPAGPWGRGGVPSRGRERDGHRTPSRLAGHGPVTTRWGDGRGSAQTFPQKTEVLGKNDINNGRRGRISSTSELQVQLYAQYGECMEMTWERKCDSRAHIHEDENKSVPAAPTALSARSERRRHARGMARLRLCCTT